MNNSNVNNSTRPDAYQLVSDLIIAQLEEGRVPWSKPWRSRFGNRLPQNLQSKKEYRGINLLMLGMSRFDDPRWCTFNQARAMGGTVRKGEKGSLIVFWKVLELSAEESRTGVPASIPFLKYSFVFNMNQIDGLENKTIPGLDEVELGTFSPIVEAESVYANMPNRPELKHGFSGAHYAPGRDMVGMPDPNTFLTPEDYYLILFHELAHSTGHESRLNRKTIGHDRAAFGSANYGFEELVAEMASAMVGDACGVEVNYPRTADYIAGWIEAIKKDKTLVFSAASKAQAAADFILGVGK